MFTTIRIILILLARTSLQSIQKAVDDGKKPLCYKIIIFSCILQSSQRNLLKLDHRQPFD